MTMMTLNNFFYCSWTANHVGMLQHCFSYFFLHCRSLCLQSILHPKTGDVWLFVQEKILNILFKPKWGGIQVQLFISLRSHACSEIDSEDYEDNSAKLTSAATVWHQVMHVDCCACTGMLLCWLIHTPHVINNYYCFASPCIYYMYGYSCIMRNPFVNVTDLYWGQTVLPVAYTTMHGFVIYTQL